MFNFACGDLIGEGTTRKVFACRFNSSYVLKVEIPKVWRTFDNVREFEFWQDHRHIKAVAEWLCPVTRMSPDGRILMQDRAERIPESYIMPEQIPAFLCDQKRENFGLLNGRLVCVDYALQVTSISSKMIKAKWRD